MPGKARFCRPLQRPKSTNTCSDTNASGRPIAALTRVAAQNDVCPGSTALVEDEKLEREICRKRVPEGREDALEPLGIRLAERGGEQGGQRHAAWDLGVDVRTEDDERAEEGDPCRSISGHEISPGWTERQSPLELLFRSQIPHAIEKFRRERGMGLADALREAEQTKPVRTRDVGPANRPDTLAPGISPVATQGAIAQLDTLGKEYKSEAFV